MRQAGRDRAMSSKLKGTRKLAIDTRHRAPCNLNSALTGGPTPGKVFYRQRTYVDFLMSHLNNSNSLGSGFNSPPGLHSFLGQSETSAGLDPIISALAHGIAHDFNNILTAV